MPTGMGNLLRHLLSLYFVLLLIAVFFWLWGRFGYSFWTIPLIVLCGALGIASPARAVKVADITRIGGQRSNVLTGLGLGAEQLAAVAAVEAGVPFYAVLPYPEPESVWPAAAQASSLPMEHHRYSQRRSPHGGVP